MSLCPATSTVDSESLSMSLSLASTPAAATFSVLSSLTV